LSETPIFGSVGVGHTRWATHGKPSQINAHPHKGCKKDIVVVHNGIIENYSELKKELIDKAHIFSSETDTEVLVHLVEEYYKNDLVYAVRMALSRVRGSYALVVIDALNPDLMVAARKGSPLVIGLGPDSSYVASDIPALLKVTRRMVFLEDDEVACITSDTLEITRRGKPVNFKIEIIEWDPVMAEKGGFEHFMLKEIHEQPQVIMNTLRGRIFLDSFDVKIEEMSIEIEKLKSLDNITVAACGTSYHAALILKYIVEKIAKVRVSVDYASEYRYRNPVYSDKELLIVISQSGETADTLAALRLAKKNKIPVMAIVNVMGSTMTREADGVLYTRAGPEIGVASTKAFLAQVTASYIWALYLAKILKRIDKDFFKEIVQALFNTPRAVETVVEKSSLIKKCAKIYNQFPDLLFMGRGLSYPVALEGALKLKEISYIHAEGYPSGEMKHGPIALIEPSCPTIAIALEGDLYEKILSNIQEVKARNGKVIGIGYADDTTLAHNVDFLIPVPRVHYLVSPLVSTVPTQLFAYFCAVIRGCDVDKPRNLAKSVTVE
jgi:glucosamine--fructose-6-phosphate aminotransferase (isomerizing)